MRSFAEKKYNNSLRSAAVPAARSGVVLKDNRPGNVQLKRTASTGVVQRVVWGPAANRAPLEEIRDYESGVKGNRPKLPAQKLRDFRKVQDILHDNDTVAHHMGNLNGKIEALLARKGNKLSARAALLTVLREAEAQQGYDPEDGIISADDGTSQGAAKLSAFGKAGKAFQDFGVSPTQHGPDTHRIQQYILYRENLRRQENDQNHGTQTAFEHHEGAFGVYKDMADYRYGIHTNDYKLNQHSPDRRGRQKIYAWELLLDRVNGKDGVDVIDQHSHDQAPLQPDAGYPIHLMEQMKLGNYGAGISAAALGAKADSDAHIKALDRNKMLKQGGTSALAGAGLGVLGYAAGLAGWPLALLAGAGMLGGYLYGKKKWK